MPGSAGTMGQLCQILARLQLPPACRPKRLRNSRPAPPTAPLMARDQAIQPASLLVARGRGTNPSVVMASKLAGQMGATRRGNRGGTAWGPSQNQVRRGSPTPPKRPTEGLPRGSGIGPYSRATWGLVCGKANDWMNKRAARNPVHPTPCSVGTRPAGGTQCCGPGGGVVRMGRRCAPAATPYPDLPSPVHPRGDRPCRSRTSPARRSRRAAAS